MLVRIGHSADPDDAFMVWGLATGNVDARGFEFEFVPEDIQVLNEWALEGRLEVTALSLATYPLVQERYDLRKVAMAHRLGRVEVGETSVAIAVSAPHRQDALAACADAIEALKEQVPLWKKEVYEGGEEWIGRGS